MTEMWPCNRGMTDITQYGFHQFQANSVGIVVCAFCGKHPPAMSANPPREYGLMHPTWHRPEAFSYDTAEDAQAGIERTYGKESGHTVVRIETVRPASEAGEPNE